MGNYTTLLEFVNTDAPKPFKINGASSRLFRYPDLAINHVAIYLRQLHGTGLGYLNRKITGMYVNQITAISQMAANTGNGDIVFINSGDGLAAYACAMQTKNKVYSIHSCKDSLNYAKGGFWSLHNINNLKFKQGNLEDVVSNLNDGDTVVCLEMDQREEQALVELHNTKKLNVIMGVTSDKTYKSLVRSSTVLGVKSFGNNLLSFPQYEHIEAKFFHGLENRLEMLAAPDEIFNTQTYLLMRPKRKIHSKFRNFLKNTASIFIMGGITWGAVHLTLNHTPLGPLMTNKYVDMRVQQIKYSEENMAPSIIAVDMARFAYEESIKKLERDPNNTHVALASYSGAFYNDVLNREVLKLPSSKDQLWKPKLSKKWEEISGGLQAPREMFIADFIAQTEKLQDKLKELPQRSDGLYNLVQKSIDNAEFRIKSMSALKEHGIRSKIFEELQINRIQYQKSTFFTLREIMIRDGQAGMAALEHRLWAYTISNVLMNQDSIENPSPHNADLISIAYEQSIYKHWKHGGIDPNFIPGFSCGDYEKDIIPNLQSQGYSDEKIREITKRDLILGDPTNSEFAKERERIWRSWGYTDNVIDKLLKMESTIPDPNKEWFFPLSKVMDTNKQEPIDQDKLQRQFRESGLSVEYLKNSLLENGLGEDFVNRFIDEHLLNPMVIGPNSFDPNF